jgi:hypothetical protein
VISWACSTNGKGAEEEKKKKNKNKNKRNAYRILVGKPEGEREH